MDKSPFFNQQVLHFYTNIMAVHTIVAQRIRFHQLFALFNVIFKWSTISSSAFT